MVKVLTPYELRELTLFLKRWGIDHPELLAEMVDHYGEKMLNEMAEGRKFQEILSSWKTKTTFHALRHIQREYEEIYPSLWRKNQWKVAKSILFGHDALWYFPLLVVLIWLYSFPSLIESFHVLLIMKIIAAFGIIIYFLIRKRTRYILSFRNFGAYYIFYTTIFQTAFRLVWKEDPEWQSPNMAVPVIIWVSIVIDYVYLQLWRKTLVETSSLTMEMLEEHIPKHQSSLQKPSR